MSASTVFEVQEISVMPYGSFRQHDFFQHVHLKSGKCSPIFLSFSTDF